MFEPTYFDAVQNLTGGKALHGQTDGGIEKIVFPEGFTPPTDTEVKTKLASMVSDYDAQEYARARQPLYPAIGDQLDDLYHKGAFSAEMTATLKKVKDDNPK